jgi:hypothetical protein
LTAPGFRDRLDELDTGFEADIPTGSPVVLVAFGGLALEVGGIPPFELFNLVSDLEVGKLFVRDLEGAFYHRGVKGLGATIPQVAGELRRLLGRARRTIFVGPSAGGYAALLFGSLVGADEVHAFSGATFLDDAHRRIWRDDRWQEQMVRVRAGPPENRPFLDLKPVLRARPAGSAHLHFGARHRLDHRHASRMRRISGVRLHPYPTDAHMLARQLRDRGELKAIVRAAVERP